MRILHLIATLARESGGTAQACLEMAQAVARRGHQVSVYTTNWTERGADDTPLGIPRAVWSDGTGACEIRTFAVQRPRFWKPSLPMARALLQEIDRFDVVHLHSLYLFHDLVGGWLCRRRGVPYVIEPHGLLDPYIRRRRRGRKRLMEALFQNGVLRRAAAIRYTCDVERELSEPFACGAPGRVAPLGVDLDGFDNLPPRARFTAAFPETAGRRIVLFLGRLHEKKGLDLLVPAFAHAAARHPDLHLVLAGPDDGMAAPAKALARQHGVAERTTFTGMLVGEAKFAAFAAADLSVLPSYSENFGIAAVEGMAAGIPTIVSDRVAIHRELAQGGGAAVVPCDAAALAHAIEHIAGDPAAAAAMGSAARATVERLYRWNNAAAALEAIYREAAARRRR